MKLLLSAFFSVTALALPPTQSQTGLQRAKELREYLNKEKPKFEERETRRKDLLSQVDQLNAEQNQVRQRLQAISSNQHELAMAVENLSIEVKKQKELEVVHRQKLLMLLKVVYKIRKDGMLRFVIQGENLSALAGRARILYRTLRSHTLLTQQLAERSLRLAETEKKLAQTQIDIEKMLVELGDHETLLKSLLKKKHHALTALNQKQSSYQVVAKEYKRISKHLALLFDNFESMRSDGNQALFPSRGTLPLPVADGRVVKAFGKSIHEKFGTVTYQKGIEIEAAHETPVQAVMPGVVEYEGWVKGLGNVVILHHGGGFYSLSAHLYKSMKPKGSQVTLGETIGLVGDTGSNEKPSLYFELRENGKAIDPIVYFSKDALTKLR